MIATLNGEVTEKNIDRIILDVNGIGYELALSQNEITEVSLSKKIKVYVYEHIKEDSYDLYGFMTKDSLNLFRQLLSVKNIGPKNALSILSSGSVKDIKQAIAGGDVKYIMAAKGVGKRAAEQVIVELRDKVGLASSADEVLSRSGINPSDEAFQALVSLGYSETDAASTLSKIDDKLPTEERVKIALKG